MSAYNQVYNYKNTFICIATNCNELSHSLKEILTHQKYWLSKQILKRSSFFFHNLHVDIHFFLNWNDSVNRDDENPKTNLENFAVIKNVHFKSNKGISDESPPLGTKIELLYHVVAISTIYLTKRRGLQTKIDVILIIWDEIEKVKYENVFTYIHT